jgi:hypothetical protein
MGAQFRETWREGSFVKEPVVYERTALWMVISPYEGSVGQTGVGSSTGTSRYG